MGDAFGGAESGTQVRRGPRPAPPLPAAPGPGTRAGRAGRGRSHGKRGALSLLPSPPRAGAGEAPRGLLRGRCVREGGREFRPERPRGLSRWISRWISRGSGRDRGSLGPCSAFVSGCGWIPAVGASGFGCIDNSFINIPFALPSQASEGMPKEGDL